MINIGFQKRLTALRSLIPKGLDTRQTDTRNYNNAAYDYRQIDTLDPARVAQAFQLAEQGYIHEQAKLFTMIEERDAHIYDKLNKRRLAITSLKWQLVPPRDATQSEIDRTAELSDMLTSIDNFEDFQFDMTDAIGKGFVAMEFNWKPGSTFLPASIDFVPQALFQIDLPTNELMYVKRGIPEPLRPFGWIKHEHRAKSGYMEQCALFRVLTWLYAFKAYDYKDMNRFLEVYGIPLRLGKYPAGVTPGQRQELLKAVRNIGNDGAGIIPANMLIEFVEAKQKGNVDDFLKVIKYWEEKQSGAILGGEIDGQGVTETRLAIYEKVREEIKLHDVKQLEPSYRKGLIVPICALNGLFPPGREPSMKMDTEQPADQAKMIDVLTKAVNLGMEIDKDWGHQSLQIPRAKEGSVILGKATPTPAALRAALAKTPLLQQGDIAAAYAAQLTALAMPHEQAMITHIYDTIRDKGSIEDAIAALATIELRGINSTYVDLIADGFSAAHLAGRVDAKK
ncbi:hypothetical protein JCM14076_06360 [Methylosoma difficile]